MDSHYENRIVLRRPPGTRHSSSNTKTLIGINVLFIVPRIYINVKKLPYFGTKYKTMRRFDLSAVGWSQRRIVSYFVPK